MGTNTLRWKITKQFSMQTRMWMGECEWLSFDKCQRKMLQYHSNIVCRMCNKNHPKSYRVCYSSQVFICHFAICKCRALSCFAKELEVNCALAPIQTISRSPLPLHIFLGRSSFIGLLSKSHKLEMHANNHESHHSVWYTLRHWFFSFFAFFLQCILFSICFSRLFVCFHDLAPEQISSVFRIKDANKKIIGKIEAHNCESSGNKIPPK